MQVSQLLFPFLFLPITDPISSDWSRRISPLSPMSITPLTYSGISLQTAGLFIFSFVQKQLLPFLFSISSSLIILFRSPLYQIYLNSPASAAREIQFWPPTWRVGEQRGPFAWRAGKRYVVWQLGPRIPFIALLIRILNRCHSWM